MDNVWIRDLSNLIQIGSKDIVIRRQVMAINFIPTKKILKKITLIPIYGIDVNFIEHL